MGKVFTEITRLSDKDCFYIVERHKTEFTYPLHRHKEFELNFIEKGKGVRRIVGDSVEEIGDYELVLIGGACIAINVMVAMKYDAKGNERPDSKIRFTEEDLKITLKKK